MVSMVAAFMLSAQKTMACDNHDLETIYSSYNYSFDVVSNVYAMDQETFDIAIAGTISRSDGPRGFFYYLEDASCSVKWHYLFEDEISALQIRSQSNSVYGVIKTEDDYYFFVARTDIGSQEELTFELYTFLDFDDRSDTFNIVAPLASTSIYILQEEDFMRLTP